MSANETTLHPNNNLQKQTNRSMYGLQHGALADTEQKDIKGLKITSVKPFKQENQPSNIYKKRETRNTYKLHKQTTTTVHQINTPKYSITYILCSEHHVSAHTIPCFTIYCINYTSLHYIRTPSAQYLFSTNSIITISFISYGKYATS